MSLSNPAASTCSSDWWLCAEGCSWAPLIAAPCFLTLLEPASTLSVFSGLLSIAHCLGDCLPNMLSSHSLLCLLIVPPLVMPPAFFLLTDDTGPAGHSPSPLMPIGCIFACLLLFAGPKTTLMFLNTPPAPLWWIMDHFASSSRPSSSLLPCNGALLLPGSSCCSSPNVPEGKARH